MRTRILIYVLTSVNLLLYGQSSPNANTGYANSQPVPSASSLTTYMNSPVSIATGTPDISFPLVSIPVGKINIGFTMNYHPVNNAQREPASDIGRGWSLIGSSVITKEVNNLPDEIIPLSEATEYDDIHYFNIPGNSGKFKITKDKITKLHSIINLTPNKLKLEYTQANVSGKFILDSFSITDNQGYKYYFDKHGTSTFIGLFAHETYKHRSIYYLTKIENENGKELVKYHYDYVDTKYDIFSGLVSSNIYKLSKINVHGVGSININYIYEPNILNADRYRLNYISLNTVGGKQISKFEFNNNNNNNNRILIDVKKYGTTNTTQEVTKFSYDSFYHADDFKIHPDALSYGIEGVCYDSPESWADYVKPWVLSSGVINKVTLPTGGVIKYKFEPHKEFVDKSSTEYQLYQYKIDPDNKYITSYLNGEILEYDFNWKESQEVTFDITGPERYFYIKQYYALKKKPIINGPDTDPNGNLPLRNWSEFTKDGQIVDGFVPQCKGGYPESGNIVSRIKLKAGTYKLTLHATYGDMGFFQIFEEKSLPEYRNEGFPDQLGLRIKKISNYNEDSSTLPTSETSYNYQEFDKPNNSSGYYAETSLFNNGVDVIPYKTSLLYKNVTLKEGNKQGYTEYTYKTLKDFPYILESSSSSYFPYLNLALTGLPEKEEVFNASKQKLSSTVFTFTMQEVDMPRYFEGNHVGHYTRTAFVKKENSITTTYFQNGANPIQTSSEAIKDDNFNLILEKNVTADGLIEEKLYNYANNHPVLTPRNIITTPLQIISKRNNSPISKSEIKYENPSNIYPSYTLSYYLTSNENDWENSINANIDKRFDIYDDMGNMVQQSINPTSTEEALFVTTIWGYNKSLPIANIVGAKLNQLNIDSVNLLVTRSDEYANASPSAEVSAEANYLSALESFRIANASSEYQITGYSYYPLIGISQVIPPNGIKEIYEYDNYNRLMKIKNVNGIVLKEVNYNNKQ